MANKQLVKISIGTEPTPGAAAEPTAVLPIRDIGSLDRNIDKKQDPVIIGAGMANGEYAVSADAKGSIPLSPRSCTGWGKILKGALGSETATQIMGIVRIRYKGSSASARVTTDVSAKSINVKIGTLGAEANDTTFGSSGTILLTDTTADTLAELVAKISTYTDYEAKLVTGSGASTIASVVSGTFQAKNKWVYLLLTGTTGAYAHRFTPDLTVGSERPTYTIQKDGFQDNIRYKGNAVDVLSISSALKAEVEADVELLAFTEAIGQTAMSALSLNDSKPYVFGGGIVNISGLDYNFCRKAGFKIKNNLKSDGYGQSSLDRAYHAKGIFAVEEGEISLRLDENSYIERAKVESGVIAPISLVYFAAEGKKIGSSGVNELMIIEIPYAELSNFKFDANGDIIDCTCSFKGFYPGGTVYDGPLVITITTADSTAY